jgi:hypothetical protein
VVNNLVITKFALGLLALSSDLLVKASTNAYS